MDSNDNPRGMKNKDQVTVDFARLFQEGDIKLPDLSTWQSFYDAMLPEVLNAFGTFSRSQKISPPKERREHRLDMGSYFVDVDLDKPWPRICRHCGKLGIQKAEGDMSVCMCRHCGGLN